VGKRNKGEKWVATLSIGREKGGEWRKKEAVTIHVATHGSGLKGSVKERRWTRMKRNSYDMVSLARVMEG